MSRTLLAAKKRRLTPDDDMAHGLQNVVSGAGAGKRSERGLQQPMGVRNRQRNTASHEGKRSRLLTGKCYEVNPRAS